VALFMLLSGMATESASTLIKAGWTGVCFDSLLILAAVQVTSTPPHTPP
jgi:hypothetical protein